MSTRKGDRLDDAARAAWLYYIAGNTQDEIASKLGVSRQSAQRLVAQAMAAGMVKVAIDHPIARCLDLAADLRRRFALKFCEVAPTDPASSSGVVGVAAATAQIIEGWLGREAPLVMGLGTGRTLRAAVRRLERIDCPQHRIVSLTGNISSTGSTAYYNVLFSIGERVTAPTFPIPMPVVAATAEERAMVGGQPMIRRAMDLARLADLVFVGVGELGDEAPLFVDGFISRADLEALRAAGAVGEIVGWTFDAAGRLIEGLTNDRVASAPLRFAENALVVGAAMGLRKLPAIRAAMAGGLINGLVTDELTAEHLLK